MNTKEIVGKIISISDLNIRVLIINNEVKIQDILYFIDTNGTKHMFEITELESNIAVAIPFNNVQGLKKGVDLYLEPGGLQVEYSDNILGKMFSSYGETIDGTTFESISKKNVYDRKLSIKEINIDGDVLYTGIKAIDFFAPLEKGFKMGLIGGAGVGKTVLIKELINKFLIH